MVDNDQHLRVSARYDFDIQGRAGYRGQISASGLVIWESRLYEQEYQALEAAEEHYVEAMRRLFHAEQTYGEPM